MISARAEAFRNKNSADLIEWFKHIGLDMYADLIEEKMVTGEKLADIVSSEDNDRQLVVSGTTLSKMHAEWESCFGCCSK